MWASSWKRLENEAKGRDFNNKYLKKSLYCMAAKINTEFANNSEFDENIKEFARKFAMKITNLKGSMEIAEQSYFAARNNITGELF
jgi:hypothetical protein